MSNRITFARAADGSFNFGESRLTGLVDQLFGSS